MIPLMLLLSFIGSWLLFAGAILQAALELSDQDFKRDRLQEAMGKAVISPHVSTWWWLLPPVRVILEFRQTKKWRREYFSHLPQKDREALVDYASKAKGWFFVAGGSFLISINETWQFGMHYHWTTWLIITLMFVLAYFSLFNTVAQLKLARRVSDMAEEEG